MVDPRSRKGSQDSPPRNRGATRISNQRLTFALSDEALQDLQVTSARCSIARAVHGDDSSGLPSTPSAIAREAIDFWLDQLRPDDRRTRSDDEWFEYFEALRRALSSGDA